MDIIYELIELPREFPFILTDMELPPYYSMGDKYHWHDCFELSFAKAGSGSYFVENRNYSFNPGELMIINNIEPHRMQVGENGLNQLVLVFNPSLIWSGSKDLLDYDYMKAFVDRGEGFHNKISQENPFFKEINDLIFDIEREYKIKQSGWQLMIKAKLLSLLTILYRHFKTDAKDQIGKRSKLIRMQPVLGKIEENLKANIDSKEMAQLLHITPQHFSTLFKDTMGQNFIEYLATRRVALVKEELLNSDKGITEIAYECGFHNLSHFNFVFHKFTGETPSAFRNHNR